MRPEINDVHYAVVHRRYDGRRHVVAQYDDPCDATRAVELLRAAGLAHVTLEVISGTDELDA
jgi:hypothetical protein